jgi:hypothetical protein
MQSTLIPKPSDDPHDVLMVAPDIVLVAPTNEELSKLAHIMRHPSNPQARTEPDFSESPPGPSVPPVDTTFRAVPSHRPSMGAHAMRAFIGFLLAVGIGIAAAVWQTHGDAAQQMIARWVPQLALTSSPPPENPGLAGQPDQAAEQASAANSAPAQPAPPAQAASEGVAAVAASAPSAAEAPSLQSMARDLAAAGQQIEQLKASIAQLKASQEQMSRDVAKVSEAKVSEVKASEARASEQSQRPRISALPPRPAAAPARKPVPSFRPAQAAATPISPPAAAPYVPRQPDYAPRQVEPLPPPATALPPPPAQPPLDPELTSVPRPPMPLSQ